MVKDPSARIQAALDASSHGQTIWVGPGVYQEHDLDFKGKQVRLASVGLQERTVIDGQGLGRGFYFHTAETTARVVDGWTIRNGLGVIDGGGMYMDSSSPTLTQVTLTGNSAAYGGGMLVASSSPTLTQVTLTGNSANLGGGISLDSSMPTLTQVTLTGNSANLGGGGIYIGAGGPTVIIRNTILVYNLNYNLFIDPDYPVDPTLTWCNLYSPSGQLNHNLSSLDATNLTVEPGFLRYINGLPVDFHLAKTSPLINVGDPTRFDPDGSRSDLGIYGGAGGDGWDRDGDGYYDYFWPGTIADAPEGFEAGDWDAHDGDATVH